MKLKIFPSLDEAIITTAIISFLIGLCMGIFLLFLKLSLKDYISSLATLIAAFSGAWLAFHLTNRAKIRQEEEQKFMELSKALFVLSRQINAIRPVGSDVNEYSDNERMAFQMPAYKMNDYIDLKIDFNGLAFLASTEYVQDILELTIEQERFEQVLECIRVRHQHYHEKVLPELVSNNLTNSRIDITEYKDRLREDIYKGALQSAEQVRSEVDAYLKSSMRMYKRLNSIATSIFPKRRFIEIRG